MEELENKEQENFGQKKDESQTDTRKEIFSETIRAGKRTYFFDVKSTRAGEYYLTITESKRRFSNDSGKFFYEKHKLFLYKEDFEKFSNGLKSTIEYIEANQQVIEDSPKETAIKDPHLDVDFEDLGAESVEAEDKSENS